MLSRLPIYDWQAFSPSNSFLWTAVGVRPAGQATRKIVCKNCAVYKQQQQYPPPRMLFYCTNLIRVRQSGICSAGMALILIVFV